MQGHWPTEYVVGELEPDSVGTNWISRFPEHVETVGGTIDSAELLLNVDDSQCYWCVPRSSHPFQRCC